MEKIVVCVAAILIFLVFILVANWWHRKCFVTDQNDIIYIMHLTRSYFWMGIAGIIFFSLLSILSLFFIDEEAIFAFCTFYVFTLGALYLCICAVLWKCVIKTDSLIFYTPFCPIKGIKFYEITEAKCTKRRIQWYGDAKIVLDGYHNRKKLFSIDETMDGFELLYLSFKQSGKIKDIPVIENFSVTAEKGDIILASITCPCFAGMFVFMLWKWEEVGLLYIIASGLVVLGCLPGELHALLWRVTIDFNTVSVRNCFGIVKTYEISKITKVVELENDIVLYASEKKVVKIPRSSNNFIYFAERLRRQGL